MKKTLTQIIEAESKNRHEDGAFGIKACKKEIKWRVDFQHKSLYEQLEWYVERANNENGFNEAMVLACWEMINENK